MSITKTLHVAFLTSGLLVLQITLVCPARAGDDAPPNPPPAAPAAPGPTAPDDTVATALTPYIPMTQADRFHHYVNGMFSVEAVARAFAGAAILQAMNTPAEWGQGSEGYARRFGSDYAQHIIRQTLQFSASDLLDEDNRYLPSGRSGTGPRLAYAVESTFLARRHDGHRRLSYSRLGAVIATAFISRKWQPHSTNGAQNAEMSVATVLGTEVGFNIAREFLPRIFH